MRVVLGGVVVWVAACGGPADTSGGTEPGSTTAGSSSEATSGDETGAGAPTSSSTSGVATTGGADETGSSGGGSSGGEDGTTGASTGGDAPIDCSGVTIPGVLRQTTAQVRTNAYLDDVDVTRYAGIWEAHNAQTGDDRSTRWGALAGFAFGVYTGQYVALEFTTDAAQAQVGQMFREADAAFKSSWSYWSISRCPGDFPATQDACHGAGGAVGSIGWEIGTSEVPNYCHLEPDTTYYFNIVFVAPDDPTTSSCPEDVCGHVYQQTVF